MYLYKAIYENVGPLTTVCVDFPFHESGLPKPVIIAGKNGSGKSTVLSNIVDAFYEMAGKQFANARQRADEGIAEQYYKAIMGAEIHSGTSYMVSYLLFKGINEYRYTFKCGNIGFDSFADKFGIEKTPRQWDGSENIKQISMSKENAKDEWSKNVFCYFGPDRYERPSWMGEKYYNINDFSHPSVKPRLDGKLDNPISVKDVSAATLQWLLDIIADSRADIRRESSGSLSIERYVNVNNLLLLRQARTNLETILSKIVGEEVYFALNIRNAADSRFRILRKKDDSVFCPTLDSLSTGQAALFNMFATIVRYADSNDINKSIQMHDIQGIVVIDEIELHLHTNLQKEILPELIKLFPKIQFIITSHSPLFLLGMRDTFCEDGVDVYEMPTAAKIDVEKFSEFQRAYDYLKQTQKYNEEAEAAIRAVVPQGKAIIITEGHTDWKHIEAAFNALKASGQHNELFGELDFELFKYGPQNSPDEYFYKLEMGNEVLCPLCENLAKIPQTNKYIFIADRDDEKINKKLSVQGTTFKDWGNNVYSLVLPVPSHRKDTPAISIEHYYTDDEIKTEWHDPKTGNIYRLYIGNEFDERGLAPSIDRFCEKRSKCGENSIAIIEGSSGEKVTSIGNDDGINFALSKSIFAKMVLEKQAPFDSFNFDSFLPLFETIKSIIEEKPEDQNA